MIMYGLKNCDTCKKATRQLQEAGAELGVIDVRRDGVSRADLIRFHEKFGAALINRSSTTWRGLSEADKLRDPIDLLTEFPTLMKRPVIDADGTLYLGWKADVQDALLG